MQIIRGNPNPEGDPPSPDAIIQQPTPLSLTAGSIHSLVMALNALTPLALKIANVQVIEGFPSHPEIDGGAQLAATQTIVHICDRLDRIVKEDERWSAALAVQMQKDSAELIHLAVGEARLRQQHIAEQIGLVQRAQAQVEQEMRLTEQAKQPPPPPSQAARRLRERIKKNLDPQRL